MTELVDRQMEQENAPNALPHPPAYRASWLDMLFDWIRTLRTPAWLAYVGILLLLVLLFSAPAWLAEADAQGHFLLVALDGALFIAYYLALMQHLDTTAGQALLQFRPQLEVDDGEFARLHYELTTLPAWRALAFGSLGLLLTLVKLPLGPDDSTMGAVIRHPATQMIYGISNAIFATFLYHTMRQLRFVTRLHAGVTRVNLYRRGPLYAFSRLTVRTGFAWILGLSLGLGPRFGALLSPQELFLVWAPLLPVAALFFILPLTGIHRLLVREKTRLQDDVDRRVESALARIHGQQDANHLSDLGELKTLLDSLLVEREVVAKLPTWPWQPGTLAGFTSALLLPLAIWLVQQLLTQWLPGQ